MPNHSLHQVYSFWDFFCDQCLLVLCLMSTPYSLSDSCLVILCLKSKCCAGLLILWLIYPFCKVCSFSLLFLWLKSAHSLTRTYSHSCPLILWLRVCWFSYSGLLILWLTSTHSLPQDYTHSLTQVCAFFVWTCFFFSLLKFTPSWTQDYSFSVPGLLVLGLTPHHCALPVQYFSGCRLGWHGGIRFTAGASARQIHLAHDRHRSLFQNLRGRWVSFSQCHWHVWQSFSISNSLFLDYN